MKKTLLILSMLLLFVATAWCEPLDLSKAKYWRVMEHGHTMTQWGKTCYISLDHPTVGTVQILVAQGGIIFYRYIKDGKVLQYKFEGRAYILVPTSPEGEAKALAEFERIKQLDEYNRATDGV